MSIKEKLGLITFSKPKKIYIPKHKRCRICKKRAHSRIRAKNTITNHPLDEWQYYCRRHAKQTIEKIKKQSLSHNSQFIKSE